MNKNEIIFGKVKVSHFELPPPEFDAITAPDRSLLIHGIPPRPDKELEPVFYKAWHKVYSKPLNHIIPSFELNAHKHHGVNRSLETIDNAATSSNWSGSVVSSNNDPFKWVTGVWKVPNPISAPGKCDGQTYHSSAWIGIDGFVSPDVLQAGTAHEETCINGVTNRNIYAWWEWFPEAEVAISNFPVSAGDSIVCLICATTVNQAGIFFDQPNTIKPHII